MPVEISRRRSMQSLQGGLHTPIAAPEDPGFFGAVGHGASHAFTTTSLFGMYMFKRDFESLRERQKAEHGWRESWGGASFLGKDGIRRNFIKSEFAAEAFEEEFPDAIVTDSQFQKYVQREHEIYENLYVEPSLGWDRITNSAGFLAGSIFGTLATPEGAIILGGSAGLTAPLAAGRAGLTGYQAFKRGAKIWGGVGALEMVALSPFIKINSDYLGKEYGVREFAIDVTLGAAIGGLIGGGIDAGLAARARHLEDDTGGPQVLSRIGESIRRNYNRAALTVEEKKANIRSLFPGRDEYEGLSSVKFGDHPLDGVRRKKRRPLPPIFQFNKDETAVKVNISQRLDDFLNENNSTPEDLVETLKELYPDIKMVSVKTRGRKEIRVRTHNLAKAIYKMRKESNKRWNNPWTKGQGRPGIANPRLFGREHTINPEQPTTGSTAAGDDLPPPSPKAASDGQRPPETQVPEPARQAEQDPPIPPSQPKAEAAQDTPKPQTGHNIKPPASMEDAFNTFPKKFVKENYTGLHYNVQRQEDTMDLILNNEAYRVRMEEILIDSDSGKRLQFADLSQSIYEAAFHAVKGIEEKGGTRLTTAELAEEALKIFRQKSGVKPKVDTKSPFPSSGQFANIDPGDTPFKRNRKGVMKLLLEENEDTFIAHRLTLETALWSTPVDNSLTFKDLQDIVSHVVAEGMRNQDFHGNINLLAKRARNQFVREAQMRIAQAEARKPSKPADTPLPRRADEDKPAAAPRWTTQDALDTLPRKVPKQPAKDTDRDTLFYLIEREVLSKKEVREFIVRIIKAHPEAKITYDDVKDVIDSIADVQTSLADNIPGRSLDSMVDSVVGYLEQRLPAGSLWEQEQLNAARAGSRQEAPLIDTPVDQGIAPKPKTVDEALATLPRKLPRKPREDAGARVWMIYEAKLEILKDKKLRDRVVAIIKAAPPERLLDYSSLEEAIEAAADLRIEKGPTPGRNQHHHILDDVVKGAIKEFERMLPSGELHVEQALRGMHAEATKEKIQSALSSLPKKLRGIRGKDVSAYDKYYRKLLKIIVEKSDYRNQVEKIIRDSAEFLDRPVSMGTIENAITKTLEDWSIRKDTHYVQAKAPEMAQRVIDRIKKDADAEIERIRNDPERKPAELLPDEFKYDEHAVPDGTPSAIAAPAAAQADVDQVVNKLDETMWRHEDDINYEARLGAGGEPDTTKIDKAIEGIPASMPKTGNELKDKVFEELLSADNVIFLQDIIKRSPADNPFTWDDIVLEVNRIIDSGELNQQGSVSSQTIPPAAAAQPVQPDNAIDATRIHAEKKRAQGEEEQAKALEAIANNQEQTKPPDTHRPPPQEARDADGNYNPGLDSRLYGHSDGILWEYTTEIKDQLNNPQRPLMGVDEGVEQFPNKVVFISKNPYLKTLEVDQTQLEDMSWVQTLGQTYLDQGYDAVIVSVSSKDIDFAWKNGMVIVKDVDQILDASNGYSIAAKQQISHPHRAVEDGAALSSTVQTQARIYDDLTRNLLINPAKHARMYDDGKSFGPVPVGVTNVTKFELDRAEIPAERTGERTVVFKDADGKRHIKSLGEPDKAIDGRPTSNWRGDVLDAADGWTPQKVDEYIAFINVLNKRPNTVADMARVSDEVADFLALEAYRAFGTDAVSLQALTGAYKSFLVDKAIPSAIKDEIWKAGINADQLIRGKLAEAGDPKGPLYDRLNDALGEDWAVKVWDSVERAIREPQGFGDESAPDIQVHLLALRDHMKTNYALSSDTRRMKWEQYEKRLREWEQRQSDTKSSRLLDNKEKAQLQVKLTRKNSEDKIDEKVIQSADEASKAEKQADALEQVRKDCGIDPPAKGGATAAKAKPKRDRKPRPPRPDRDPAASNRKPRTGKRGDRWTNPNAKKNSADRQAAARSRRASGRRKKPEDNNDEG